MTYEFSKEQQAHIKSVKRIIQSHIQNNMMFHPVWEGLPRNFFSNVFLSGGVIASLLQNEQPKDWDFYFFDGITNDEFATHLRREDLRKHIKDVDPKYVDVYGTDGKMITGQAITLDSTDSFITFIQGDPADVKRSFDYVHCTPYYRIDNDTLYISPKQYYACTHKKLIINNESIVKEWRTQKFKERGYTDA